MFVLQEPEHQRPQGPGTVWTVQQTQAQPKAAYCILEYQVIAIAQRALPQLKIRTENSQELNHGIFWYSRHHGLGAGDYKTVIAV